MLDKILPHEYSIKNGIVYRGSTSIKGADPETFEVFADIWAKDKYHVYTGSSVRKNIDATTFQALNSIFARDSKNIYFIGGTVQKIKDPGSFEVLDQGCYTTFLEQKKPKVHYLGYARDKFNVYYHEMMHGKPKILRGANRDTFEILKYGFARDDKKVYARGFRVKKADPKTFEVLSEHHSKDCKNAYYGESLIDGADPITFQPLKELLSRDKNKLYLWREPIEGCDPDNFVYVHGYDLIKDDNSVFSSGKPLPDADAKTFENLGNSFYQVDKNNVYYLGKLLKEADRKTFIVIDVLEGKDRYNYFRADMLIQPEHI